MPSRVSFRPQLDERCDDGVVRMSFRGDLDVATEAPLRVRLFQLRVAGQPVRLDLSGVTFMDLDGARVLRGCEHHAARSGWDFAAVDPSPPVQRLLEVCRRF